MSKTKASTKKTLTITDCTVLVLAGGNALAMLAVLFKA